MEVLSVKKQKNSTHTSVWIENKVLEECKSNMERLEIKFFKDYVAEALKFYNRYLKDKSNEEYINKTVIKPIEKMFKNTEDRVARLMFKQAVETAKLFSLLVNELELDTYYIDSLHGEAVDDVKKINGAIKYPYNKND